MSSLSVIVECSASGKETLSCSGLYLGNGWILTHSTIAIEILKTNAAQVLVNELETKGFVINKKNSLLQSLLRNVHSKFQVIFNENVCKRIISSDLPPLSSKDFATPPSNGLQLQDLSRPSRVRNKDLQFPTTSSSETPRYYSHDASISMLFVQPAIVKSIASIMPASEGWKLMEEGEEQTSDLDTEENKQRRSVADLEAIILSSFVILKVNALGRKLDDESDPLQMEELTHLIENSLNDATVVDKGANVYIESSPFGSLSPSVFLNSLSNGIISNICGAGQDLYLTDARCIMGAEGAPVYTMDRGRVNICGFVISPFSWKQGEWLGLSLLAAARPLFRSLLDYLTGFDIEGKADTTIKSIQFVEKLVSPLSSLRKRPEDLSLEGIASTLDNAIVGISCGGGWGTGIIINASPGLILTCAHVIRPSTNGNVVIITPNGNRVSGQVIYHTDPVSYVGKSTKGAKPGSSIWDLAIVRTISSLPDALPLATEVPPKGSPVVVVGYGMFSPNRLPTPTLSRGILSKTISVETSSLNYPGMYDEVRQIHTASISGENNFVKDEDVFSCFQQSEQVKSITEKSSVSPNTSEFNTYEELGSDKKKMYSMKLRRLLKDENGVVPVMFQTTCSVYAGNSGGPVVFHHPQLGLQVAGVMVCNTRDVANKATFPHINLAVPIAAIQKIISEYIASGDQMLLTFLGVECPIVSKLWALALIPQSRL